MKLPIVHKENSFRTRRKAISNQLAWHGWATPQWLKTTQNGVKFILKEHSDITSTSFSYRTGGWTAQTKQMHSGQRGVNLTKVKQITQWKTVVHFHYWSR